MVGMSWRKLQPAYATLKLDASSFKPVRRFECPDPEDQNPNLHHHKNLISGIGNQQREYVTHCCTNFSDFVSDS
jgi:hypothetical protein